MKRLIRWVLFLVLPISLVACVTTLENYKAKSSLEQEAIQTLLNYQNCYNAKDIKCFMATFHKDAKIMSRGRKVYSKQEYAKVIPGRMKEVLKITLGAPTSIKTEGAHVVITVPMSVLFSGGRTYDLAMTFYLVKEGDNYLIIKTKY